MITLSHNPEETEIPFKAQTANRGIPRLC